MPDRGRSMMWFRKGLRLHDNPALLEALQGAEHLYPVFCLDPGKPMPAHALRYLRHHAALVLTCLPVQAS